MFNKKITFCAIDKDMVDINPHPRPSSYFISQEYKKLERFDKGNMHNPTLKTCIPFLDSMTAGYIIPFDQDYLIDPVEKDFSVTPSNGEMSDFGYHHAIQLPKSWRKSAGENAGKFHNKWLIKTPPGYSCLFIHPMNRAENRWKMIEAVVDTDVYINAINFPFILHKRDEQFLIKKGDPMIQVIPFKRESWKKWSGFYMELRHGKTRNRIKSEWVDKYKKMFWNKKSFK
jgi:hypothetical protein